MIQLSAPARELKSAFDEAVKLAEGKVVIQAGEHAVVASPCREGWFVQKSRATLRQGTGAFAIAPDVIRRACDFLSALPGNVSLQIANGELVLRSPRRQKATCTFVTGFEETEFLEVPTALSGIETRPEFKKHLRRALVPPLLPSDDRLPTLLEIEATPRGIELSGSNGMWSTFRLYRTRLESPFPPTRLPAELLRRAFRIDSLWKKTLKISIDEVSAFGNSRAYFLWRQRDLRLADTPACPRSLRQMWTAQRPFSCWATAAEIFNGLAKLKEALRRHPAACELSWKEGALLLGAPTSGQSVRLQTNSATLERPGSVTVSTDLIYALKEAFGVSEQQLKLSNDALVYGSPAGFIATSSAKE